MRTRTSFELHPTGCRLVEVEVSTTRRGAPVADVRVRTFLKEIPGGDDPIALANFLAKYRQQRKVERHAWVTIWGLRTAHQFLRLPPAKTAELELLATREARKDIAPLAADGEGAAVGIVMGAEMLVGQNRRREVSLVAVSASDVRRRIQPFVDGGFIVDGVLTPALALTAIARSQRDQLPPTAAAFVVITARATCLAIIRDGVLLFAREMSWGYEGEPGVETPHDVGARLASEVRRSVLFFKQTFRAAVEGVVLCGDMPNLRDLTAPLGEALAVPVRTLDSLVGLDAAAIPEPAEQFRTHVAALRLAIATGADPAPPANLLPSTIRTSRAARAEMMRLAGAAAISLLLVFAAFLFVQRSASAYQRERQDIERELGQLEPEARTRDEQRQAIVLATAQRAALGSFESQGPRLARLLEALSQATSDDTVLTSINVQANGLHWHATIDGIAITDDAASGQAAVNGLIKALSDSPYGGAPSQPPSFRVVSGTGGNNNAGPDQRVVIPEGMSGVEFVLQFELAK